MPPTWVRSVWLNMHNINKLTQKQHIQVSTQNRHQDEESGAIAFNTMGISEQKKACEMLAQIRPMGLYTKKASEVLRLW